MTPTVTISGFGLHTELGVPFDLALDSGGNIYVTEDSLAPPNGGQVSVFPPLASLPTAPSATITNGTYEPQGIALDTSGNIYVANYAANDVTIYSPNSYALIAQIQGDSTGISSPVGIALDAAGDIYVANCGEVCSGVLAPPDSITVYPPLAGLPTYPDTDIAPIATITGSNTGFIAPWFIAIGP